ncbi:hypothetical protein H5410_006038, partial [Solanum commersonii]
HMARCKHKGGQVDGKNIMFLGSLETLWMLQLCQMHKQCREEQGKRSVAQCNYRKL